MSEASRSGLFVGVFLLILALVSTSCGSGGGQEQEDQAGESKDGDVGGSSGSILVEGSSTVQPITQAAAEAFRQENPDVQISVGGTGDSFEAFCNGDIQISDASRPIKDEEAQACQENGVEFVEIPVALDGLAVVVNPRNDFANNITLDQLETLWASDAQGQVDTWDDVNSEWPEQKIDLYGPGTESGTFEFFTQRVVGKEGESRMDYRASEDDNALVRGVSGDPNALGYFGFGYFEQNQQRLKALTIDSIPPSAETIQSGGYPLARPLFIYVSTQALQENPSVEEFVSFYLDNLNQFVEQVHYVKLSDQALQGARDRFQNRATGTALESTTRGGEQKGKAK